MRLEPDPPIDTTAAEAFASLGNETRLKILYALWEARTPDGLGDEPVSFTTLRKRVGMRDGSQFNYHLQQLIGRFVHRDERGHVLTRLGEQIVGTVLAGTMTESITFDAEPLVDPCPLCGGAVVIHYGTDASPDKFTVCCTACEGAWASPSQPAGLLMSVDPLLPVGIRGRSPSEMYEAQNMASQLHIDSLVAGICPTCTGPVTANPLLCSDHSPAPGTVCTNCSTIFELQFLNICSVCKYYFLTCADRHLIGHPTVAAFYYDHGVDTMGHDWLKVHTDTIVEQTVLTEDPLSVRFVAEIDGDRLEMTLDCSGPTTTVRV